MRLRTLLPHPLFQSLLLITPTALVSAAKFTLTLPSTSILQNPNSLPPSTHAVLYSTGPPLTAPLTTSNTFVFENVSTGSYLARVHCRDYFFEPLRIDVGIWVAGSDEVDSAVVGQKTAMPGQGSAEQAEKNTGERIEVWRTFPGHEWDNKGERRGAGRGDKGVIVEVRAEARKEYYQARSGFSLLAFIKSPMILMALFSLGMIVGIPYLLDNMDPETRAEFEEMQKQSSMVRATDTATQIQNFDMASWLAGKTNANEGPEAHPQPQQHQHPKRRRG